MSGLPWWFWLLGVLTFLGSIVAGILEARSARAWREVEEQAEALSRKIERRLTP